MDKKEFDKIGTMVEKTVEEINCKITEEVIPVELSAIIFHALTGCGFNVMADRPNFLANLVALAVKKYLESKK